MMFSCVTKMGYWKPGTNFDTVIDLEEYSALSPEQQEEYVKVEYRELDQKYVTDASAGLTVTGNVYEDVRPLIPEPLATGGTLILGMAATALTLLSRKKVVTRLLETAQGVQDFMDGKEESLTVSLESAQSDDTKNLIKVMKVNGKIRVNPKKGS